MKHSLSNLSGGVFEIFEIYAPAGRHFDFAMKLIFEAPPPSVPVNNTVVW